jgi:flagellar biosynthetic protein FliR
MTDPGAMAVLAAFYDSIDVYLLIFVRVLAFFLYVPVISSMNIPVQVKITVAVCLSAAIFSSGTVTIGPYDDTITGYFTLIVHEFITGVFFGYILYFIFASVLYAGQIIDYKIGFAMVNVLDPMTQIQVPIVGNSLFLLVNAMLVISGGVHSFVHAFFYTFQVLPIGAGSMVGNAPLAWYVLMMFTNFLLMGVKIALPILASMMVIDAALGILVKAVPQMNIFVVGMPMKVLVGLILLFTILIPSFGFVFNQLFDTAINELINLAHGMLYVQ